MIIGRSGEFTEFITLLLQRCLGDQPTFTLENVSRLNQRMKPVVIGTAADEVRCLVLVIMRIEIECALIEGDLEPVQVLKVWAEKVEYFGIGTCSHDGLGCMPNMQWPRYR